MKHYYTTLMGCLLVLSLLTACAPPKEGQQSPTASISTPTENSSLPAGPLSSELIDDALVAGKLDEETALIYKVFADFRDPRLPAEFQGSQRTFGDSHIIDEVQARWNQLTPATQDALRPFLVPPIYNGSWASPEFRQSAEAEAKQQPTPTQSELDPDTGSGSDNGEKQGETSPTEFEQLCTDIQSDLWDSVAAMHSPVRFWWLKSRPEDGAYVQTMMTAMDDEIWPDLTGLMGRVPLSDGDSACNGGGPEFDVYVAPMISGGLTVAYAPPGCKNAPVYILLSPTVGHAFLTHEFMHAVTWAYDVSSGCKSPEYSWLSEATSDWAIDFVYPDDNTEQDSIPGYYNPKIGPPTLFLKDGKHEYGAYLFFFFLARHFGQPDIIKTAWENTESMASVSAVDKAIPGGFDEVWPLFSVNNVVEPPYDDYQRWDNLNQKPSGPLILTKGEVSPNQYYDGVFGLSPLTHYYEWYTFSEDARLITFFNGLAYDRAEEPINTFMGTLPIDDGTTQFTFTQRSPEKYKGLKIQAYFKVAGDVEWQLEDWTDKAYVSFCRDALSERLTDLIVITSNSSQDSAGISGQGNLLQVSDIGCFRYGGSASFSMTGEGDGGLFTDEHVIPNVAFERTEAHPNIPYPILHFKVAEGQFNRTYNYASKEDSCTGFGEQSLSLSGASTPFGTFGNDLFILAGGVNGASVRRYSGDAMAGEGLTVNFTYCEQNTSANFQPYFWFGVDLLSQYLKKSYIVPDGGELNGTDSLLNADHATLTYAWNLVPLAESKDTAQGESGEQPLLPPVQGLIPSSPGTTTSPAPTPIFSVVPAYPNAISTEVSPTGLVMILTEDPITDIVAFYTDAMVNQGWTAAPPQGGTSDNPAILLNFAKDRTMIVIMIAPGEDSPTAITIYQVSG